MTTTSTASHFANLVRQGRMHETTIITDGRNRTYYLHEIDGLLGSSEVTPEACNIYVGLNPVVAPVTYDGKLPKRPTDDDIAHIHNIWVDVDSIRPDKRRVATQDENQAAMDLAETIVLALGGLGITPVCLANTGNGAGILIRADMATTDQPHVAGLIRQLAANHTSTRAQVDLACIDNARMIRLVGTDNCKPDGERLSRPSYIVREYDQPTTVTAAMLSQFANTREPSTPCTTSHRTQRALSVTCDIHQIIRVFESRGCEIIKRKLARDEFEELTDGQSFVIRGCPVRGPKHDDADTWISLRGGRLISRCPHSKCCDKGIFHVLAAVGIKPSELSTLYPDEPTDRWHNLIDVLGKRISTVTP